MWTPIPPGMEVSKMTRQVTTLIAVLALLVAAPAAWACSESACATKTKSVVSADAAVAPAADHNTQPKGGADEASKDAAEPAECPVASKSGCGEWKAAHVKNVASDGHSTQAKGGADEASKEAAEAGGCHVADKSGCGEWKAAHVKNVAGADAKTDCPITKDCPKEKCGAKDSDLTAEAAEGPAEVAPGGGEQDSKSKAAPAEAKTHKDDAKKAYKVGSKVEGFELTDVKSGEAAKLADVSGKKVTALVFWNQECPYVVEAQDRIADFQKTYQDKGVNVVAIDAGVNNDTESIKKYAEEKPFPFLVNRDSTLAAQFGATRTPEVFLLDSDHVVQYHGAFDSGKLRSDDDTRKTYVKDAVEAMLKGEKPATAETKAFGCSLKYAKGVEPMK